MDSDIWAVTAYFNPAGYASRLRNHRLFRAALSIPLLAVELSFTGDFALGDGDADILLHMQGGDILWQKERLINLSLAALPASCTKVALLDGDIIFGRHDWAEAASRMLDERLLIQPFSHAFSMRPAWRPGDAVDRALDLRHPPAYLIDRGATAEHAVAINGGAFAPMQHAPGLAWAARRDLLVEHGLYDACIIGGGDGALMRAAFGFPDLTRIFQRMQPDRYDHYHAWAEPFGRSLADTGIGYIRGDVYHLWHGRPADRRYIDRHGELAGYGFDPRLDIGPAANGLWAWTSPKPDMHRFVRDYFAARREDAD